MTAIRARNPRPLARPRSVPQCSAMVQRASAETRARLMRRATNAAVVVAVTLAVAKLIAFGLSGSVALLASGVDSALDASASLFNALAIRYALKPADDDHRFGHGKSEALAGLAQAFLIGVSGAFVIQRAIERLLHPQPIGATILGLIVMSASLGLTLALVTYQRQVVRVTQSSAIQADALHYISDIASNLAAIAAVMLARFGWQHADPWLGILIAVFTLYSAATIGWDGFQVLMDRELSIEVQERIRRIVLTHTEVRGLHALRTRQSGATPVIQLHIELDPRLSLVEANRITHEVATALDGEFPGADVLIHPDPADPVRASRSGTG